MSDVDDRVKHEKPPHQLLRQWLTVAIPNEIHRYTFLDPKTDEIRLITLLPSDETSSKIECLLSHVSLNSKPDYEALSYAWGDQKEDIGAISLGGKPFPVTPNLESALRYLRLAEKPRTLWVDALSINQIDDEEKTHQVQHMRTIYELASRVVIWLGKASDDSDLAMDLIADIHRVGPQDYKANLEDAKSWEALGMLYRRPWWSRVWVLQETAVGPQDPIVGVGDKSLSWGALESARQFVDERIKTYNINEAISKMVISVVKTTAVSVHNIRRDFSPSLPLSSLESLLKKTMTFQSTDARDKVFALLGLAQEEDRSAIVPDYSKSVKAVYADLAIYLISKNINIIYLNIDSPYHSLPSWIPDWSWWSRRWPLWSEGLYNAGGLTVQAGRFSQDASTFTLPGLLLDRVLVCDEFIPRGRDVVFYNESHICMIVSNIETLLLNTIAEHPNNKLLTDLDPSKSDALWRTLVADKQLTRLSCPAPSVYGEQFSVLCSHSEVPETFLSDHPTTSEAEIGKRKEAYTQPFVFEVQATMSDQRFFITERGQIGIGPRHLMVNDLVVIFWGSDMPCLLREAEVGEGRAEGVCRLLGGAFIHGVMHGEAFHGIENQEELQERSEVFLLR